MRSIGCRGYRFPPEIIHRAVWLYLRFTLSFRDVENLLAERGIMVSGCKRMYLWRAVDAEGEILEVLVQAKRENRHRACSWAIEPARVLTPARPVGETHNPGLASFIEWNLVSSSQARVEQAKAEWRAGRMKLPDLDNGEFVPLPE